MLGTETWEEKGEEADWRQSEEAVESQCRQGLALEQVLAHLRVTQVGPEGVPRCAKSQGTWAMNLCGGGKP